MGLEKPVIPGNNVNLYGKSLIATGTMGGSGTAVPAGNSINIVTWFYPAGNYTPAVGDMLIDFADGIVAICTTSTNAIFIASASKAVTGKTFDIFR